MFTSVSLFFIYVVVLCWLVIIISNLCKVESKKKKEDEKKEEKRVELNMKEIELILHDKFSSNEREKEMKLKL